MRTNEVLVRSAVAAVTRTPCRVGKLRYKKMAPAINYAREGRIKRKMGGPSYNPQPLIFFFGFIPTVNYGGSRAQNGVCHDLMARVSAVLVLSVEITFFFSLSFCVT